jgi:hypothetical protein
MWAHDAAAGGGGGGGGGGGDDDVVRPWNGAPADAQAVMEGAGELLSMRASAALPDARFALRWEGGGAAVVAAEKRSLTASAFASHESYMAMKVQKLREQNAEAVAGFRRGAGAGQRDTHTHAQTRTR